jgi:hypothetical protein
MYAGGGAGGTYLRALGDSAVVPAGQIGAGLLGCGERVCVDLGYRYMRALDTRLAGHDASVQRHGPRLALSVPLS